MTELDILLWILKERFPEKNITFAGQTIYINEEVTLSIINGLYTVTEIQKHKFDDIKVTYEHIKEHFETKDQQPQKTLSKRKATNKV